jgi:hypothetical protein
MEPTSTYRPRVSRETKRLLLAGVLAIATLSVLARLRFQDLPAAPNPIPAVLRQLDARVKFTDLAAEIAQLRPNLDAVLVAIERSPSLTGAGPQVERAVALRTGSGVAVALLPAAGTGWTTPIVARDQASGLAVVETPTAEAGRIVSPWAPRGLDQPRYLIGSDPSPAGVTVRPIFVGALYPIESPLWQDPVWALPEGTDAAPGSFLFTNNAELVGLVFEDAGMRAVVPAATLLAEAERLLDGRRAAAAPLGVDVQPLTEPVRAATGAIAGVVVTWVDPEGAGAGQLVAGDVIEAVDGRPLASDRHWNVRAARIAAGEPLNLSVRRRGALLDVAITPRAATTTAPASPGPATLGLTLRSRGAIGAEVTGVDPASAAALAGLRVGDVITLIGAATAPTPAQAARTFAAATPGSRILVVITRGDRHFVTALTR